MKEAFKKPIIGITVEIDSEMYSGIRRFYVSAIEQAGGIPLLIPYLTDNEALDTLLKMCDGVLLTGGADISPEIYDSKTDALVGPLQPFRDEIEIKVFERIIGTELPILAICRGAQLVNALMGGTLYHDIESEYNTDVTHRQTGSQTDFCHEVTVREGTPLAYIIGKNRFLVNSWHHQAVKRLGRGLKVMAESDDGIIEGFYLPEGRFLRAYQWHPQKTYAKDEYSRLIFDEFISAAR